MRGRREAWHGGDFAGHGDEETGAGRELNLPDRDLKAGGAAKERGVVRKGIRGLGDAYGEAAQADLFGELDVAFRGDRVDDSIGSIHGGGDGLDLFFYREFGIRRAS